jgi:uncharacterized protein Yka (UPF0111/DUF47 family)
MANPILSLFGHSPIKPLQNHMQTVLQCVELLVPFFQAVIKEDWNAVEKTYNAIAKFESHADDQKTRHSPAFAKKFIHANQSLRPDSTSQ